MNATTPPFAQTLLHQWYASAPYNEQFPADLTKHLAAFSSKYGTATEEYLDDILSEVPDDDPMIQLVESIFLTAAKYTLARLDDAIYDGDNNVLQHIRLTALQEEGRSLFVEQGRNADNHPTPQS